MEETKENALEMAQETDATRKTYAETKTVIPIIMGDLSLWEHGVTRHHYGLQLGMITRGSSDV